MTKPKTFIHLHTLDLRIHDSPSLHLTHDPSGSLTSDTTHFLPVYVFDSRQIDTSSLPGSISAPANQADKPADKQASANPNHRNGPTKTRSAPRSRTYSLHRTSPYRLRNLIEAVYGLRESYRGSGGDMLIGWGKPEEVVPALIERVRGEYDIAGVGAQEEITVEEADMLDHLQSALKKSNIKLYRHDSKNLIPADKLPFKLKDTPDLYTSFRKKVEGLGLGTDGGMVVPPLQTAVFDADGKEGSLKVSVGPNGTGLKPYPKLDLACDKLGFTGGFVGGGQKDHKTDKLSDPKEMYAALAQPLLSSPPIGGWPENMHGTAWPELNPNSAVPFLGSEAAALARLDDYVGHPNGGDDGKWINGAKAKTYKATRNGLVGEAFSTKFAAFLALGTLSAKEAGWRVMRLLERAGKDKDMWNNVYWIVFELLWRDFFQHTVHKFASIPGARSSLFNPEGFSEHIKSYPQSERPNPADWHTPDWADENDPARRWCEGRTGVPFIDACMVELRETGWMSNRGRQNVASFLVKDLYVDWRVGAEFFEMHLVDYDTCSNWGNWQYQAGVGNDARASRQFNPIKQAADYDPSNEYVRLWIPELKNVSDNKAQTPWLHEDKSALKGYPSRPIIEQPHWKKHYGGHGGGGGGHGGRGGGGRGRGRHGGRGGRGGNGGGRREGRGQGGA